MIFLKKIKFKNIALLFSCAIFFVSCDEGIAKETLGKKKTDFPSQIIRNAKIVQRDSGMIKLRASAPLIEKYELIDTPYTVARKGIDIQYFDNKNPKTPGRITAKFARMIEKKKFYEARGNVKIVTSEGQMFAMQSVFWDQAKRQIYTSDTVYVTEKDGSTLVSAGGMKAKDDFSEFTFYNNSGDINAKNVPDVKK